MRRLLKQGLCLVAALALGGLISSSALAAADHDCGPICKLGAGEGDIAMMLMITPHDDALQIVERRLAIRSGQRQVWEDFSTAVDKRRMAALDGGDLTWQEPVADDLAFNPENFEPINAAEVVLATDAVRDAFEKLYAKLDPIQRFTLEAEAMSCPEVQARLAAAETQLAQGAFDGETLVPTDVAQKVGDFDGETFIGLDGADSPAVTRIAILKRQPCADR